MSSNKMGGVPSETRDALYEMLERVNSQNDSIWAKAIGQMTKLGPKKAMERLNRN